MKKNDFITVTSFNFFHQLSFCLKKGNNFVFTCNVSCKWCHPSLQLSICSEGFDSSSFFVPSWSNYSSRKINTACQRRHSRITKTKRPFTSFTRRSGENGTTKRKFIVIFISFFFLLLVSRYVKYVSHFQRQTSWSEKLFMVLYQFSN